MLWDNGTIIWLITRRWKLENILTTTVKMSSGSKSRHWNKTKFNLCMFAAVFLVFGRARIVLHSNDKLRDSHLLQQCFGLFYSGGPFHDRYLTSHWIRIKGRVRGFPPFSHFRFHFCLGQWTNGNGPDALVDHTRLFHSLSLSLSLISFSPV